MRKAVTDVGRAHARCKQIAPRACDHVALQCRTRYQSARLPQVLQPQCGNTCYVRTGHACAVQGFEVLSGPR